MTNWQTGEVRNSGMKLAIDNSDKTLLRWKKAKPY
jgi:hypothetical protein